MSKQRFKSDFKHQQSYGKADYHKYLFWFVVEFYL